MRQAVSWEQPPFPKIEPRPTHDSGRSIGDVGGRGGKNGRGDQIALHCARLQHHHRRPRLTVRMGERASQCLWPDDVGGGGGKIATAVSVSPARRRRLFYERVSLSLPHHPVPNPRPREGGQETRNKRMGTNLKSHPMKMN